jgi:hypothetical protein
MVAMSDLIRAQSNRANLGYLMALASIQVLITSTLNASFDRLPTFADSVGQVGSSESSWSGLLDDFSMAAAKFGYLS